MSSHESSSFHPSDLNYSFSGSWFSLLFFVSFPNKIKESP